MLNILLARRRIGRTGRISIFMRKNSLRVGYARRYVGYKAIKFVSVNHHLCSRWLCARWRWCGQSHGAVRAFFMYKVLINISNYNNNVWIEGVNFVLRPRYAPIGVALLMASVYNVFITANANISKLTTICVNVGRIYVEQERYIRPFSIGLWEIINDILPQSFHSANGENR